jgi:hypothetical protein
MPTATVIHAHGAPSYSGKQYGKQYLPRQFFLSFYSFMTVKPLRIFVTFVVIVIAGVVGFSVGRSSTSNSPPIKRPELAKAIPIWIEQLRDPTRCRVATDREAEVYSTAVKALELEADTRPLWLGIGAQQFLSIGLYREEEHDSSPICPPAGIYARAANAITASKSFSTYLVDYQLRLAGKLPDPSPYVVSAVAAVAFEEKAHHTQDVYLPLLDLRPIARTVLASYGGSASAYRERAFGVMSANDSLGTGAAQIAAATGDPAALDRVKMLMEGILSSIPKAEGIGLEQRDRLYELAYAMYFAGPDAAKYASPIQELMDRKVMSRAPPFGLVDLPPKQMCHVLDKIFGQHQSPSKSYAFCRDKEYPYPS